MCMYLKNNLQLLCIIQRKNACAKFHFSYIEKYIQNLKKENTELVQNQCRKKTHGIRKAKKWSKAILDCNRDN